jgi:hypothetical protein
MCGAEAAAAKQRAHARYQLRARRRVAQEREHRRLLQPVGICLTEVDQEVAPEALDGVPRGEGGSAKRRVRMSKESRRLLGHREASEDGSGGGLGRRVRSLDLSGGMHQPEARRLAGRCHATQPAGLQRRALLPPPMQLGRRLAQDRPHGAEPDGRIASDAPLEMRLAVIVLGLPEPILRP